MNVQGALDYLTPRVPEDLIDETMDEEVTVEGYVKSIRYQGRKLMFVDITDSIVNSEDSGPKLQIMLQSTTIPQSDSVSLPLDKWLRAIGVSAFIQVTGKPSRTKSGCLSVQAIRFPTLTKCFPNALNLLRILRAFSESGISLQVAAQAMQVSEGETIARWSNELAGGHFSSLWQELIVQSRVMAGRPATKMTRVRPPKFHAKEVAVLEAAEGFFACTSGCCPVSAEQPADYSAAEEGGWLKDAFAWSRRPLETVELRGAKKVKWASLDPVLNLPQKSAEDEGRLEYLEQKKKPQICWLLARMQELIACRLSPSGEDASFPKEKWPAVLEGGVVQVVDVGGGRGDLSLVLARELGAFGVRVAVIDLNRPSLEDGDRRAKDVGLAKDGRIVFECADVRAVIHKYVAPAKEKSLNEGAEAQPAVVPSSAPESPPVRLTILLGLHACGGLSEFLISTAMSVGADFLVCTCCFNSQPSLCTLLPPPAPLSAEEAADSLQPRSEQESPEGEEGEAKTDPATLAVQTALSAVRDGEVLTPLLEAPRFMRVLRRMAEGTVMDLSQRAMVVLNSMRLKEVIARSAQDGAAYDVRMLSFPKENSGRNVVLAGWIPKKL